jgi:predicted DNA-binding protein with PD1-like motif
MDLRSVRPKDVVMGRLSHGADLLEELTRLCVGRGVTLGRLEALGAVQKARVGFYDQAKRVYDYVDLDQPLEITKLVGNVSLKDGKPFVHAHVTLSDAAGRAYGGHLAEGTIVFACEFVLEAYEGPAFERGHDEQTGLALWQL